MEDVLKAHEPGMSPSARRARSAEPLRLVGISADRRDSLPAPTVRWHAAARERLGFPVLFITHDPSPLVESCDRIAIMYGGRIVEEAPASSLYRDSLPPYSDGLPHSFPALRGPRGEPSGIPGSPPEDRKSVV